MCILYRNYIERKLPIFVRMLKNKKKTLKCNNVLESFHFFAKGIIIILMIIKITIKIFPSSVFNLKKKMLQKINVKIRVILKGKKSQTSL